MPRFDLSVDALRAYRPDVAEPGDFDDFRAAALDAMIAAGGRSS